MTKTTARVQRAYDHRLRHLVRTTGSIRTAVGLGVPESTARGWLRSTDDANVVTLSTGEETVEGLRREVERLRLRNERLIAILRLAVVLIKALGVTLQRRRVADGVNKALLLRAVGQSSPVLGLRPSLRILGMSKSRLHAWRRESQCQLDDVSSCPRTNPRQLTRDEVGEIKEMVTSDDFRHIPTGALALLAQRMGRAFASPSTWYRLVVRHGWRRPRTRIHPAKPTTGIRAERPNEYWHVDATVIRLIDGTRVYLHAVIDNFSRRILAWKVSGKLEPGSTVSILLEAAKHVMKSQSPAVLMDGGVENFNQDMDEMLESGILRRLLAMTDISYSNSMIESWWRTLKHQWLHLNALDTITKLKSLVEFYVTEHNTRIPHSAFNGQTPDEMYFGTGEHIPDELQSARTAAMQERMRRNRARTCAACA